MGTPAYSTDTDQPLYSGESDLPTIDCNGVAPTHIQAYDCADDSAEDLWFVLNLDGTIVTTERDDQVLPYYFSIGANCYYVKTDNNSSDTPGTLASGYTEEDDCCCAGTAWYFTWRAVYSCATESWTGPTQTTRDCDFATDVYENFWRKIESTEDGCTFEYTYIGECCDDPGTPPDWPTAPELPTTISCCDEAGCGDYECPAGTTFIEDYCPCPAILTWDLSVGGGGASCLCSGETFSLLFDVGGTVDGLFSFAYYGSFVDPVDTAEIASAEVTIQCREPETGPPNVWAIRVAVEIWNCDGSTPSSGITSIGRSYSSPTGSDFFTAMPDPYFATGSWNNPATPPAAPSASDCEGGNWTFVRLC